MTKLRVVCVEDDYKTLERISALLTEMGDVEFVGSATDVRSALELIENQKPDILLLDVQLGDGSGFDVLEQSPYRNFQVIFCTAHEEHAIRAIRFSAVDYLLKPFGRDELTSALLRAKSQIHRNQISFEHLLSSLKAPSTEELRIALSDNNTIHYVRLNDIIRAEAIGNYATFYLATGERIVVSTTLGHYEGLLIPEGFFRVHRSHLVNLRHAERFVKTDGGTLVMSDGAVCEVARRRKDELLARLAMKTR